MSRKTFEYNIDWRKDESAQSIGRLIESCIPHCIALWSKWDFHLETDKNGLYWHLSPPLHDAIRLKWTVHLFCICNMQPVAHFCIYFFLFWLNSNEIKSTATTTHKRFWYNNFANSQLCDCNVFPTEPRILNK